MSDDSLNPLVKRVDALIGRQEAPRGRGEVPVLTEIVSEEQSPRRAVDSAALEALARELERIVGEALTDARAELKDSVSQMVREAVAASVARALKSPDTK